MLNWLMRLFGKKPREHVAETVSRVQPDSEPEPGHAAYLGRSPILNRKLAVVGYEFRAQSMPGSERKSDDAQLLDRLTQPGNIMFTSRRLTFIPLHPLSLLLPQVEQLPPDSLVLYLDAPAEAISQEQAEALLARVEHLRLQGYAIAVEQAVGQGTLGPLLAIANYIGIDVKGGDPLWLLEQQKHCAAAHPNSQLIARNIDSLEMLDACRRLSFQFFHGNYLTNKREWDQPRADGSRAIILELIGHLQQEDVDFKRLARTASQDLSLYYRLLRYANSAAFGLNKKYDSLEQAMVLLGQQGLRNWLTLMLFCSSKSGELDVALQETAFTRARLVELLAQEKYSRAECEQAFLVGLLSLVDTLFQMPLPDVLQQLALPEPVMDALLNHSGPYGKYLSLAVACEKGYESAVDELAKECGLNSQQVNAKQLAALHWALEFNEQLDESEQTEPAAGETAG